MATMVGAGLTTDDVGASCTLALGTALLAASLASLCAPRGSLAWKHSFCSLILLGAVAVEYYVLALVAIKLPPGTVVVLRECRQSGKGGKPAGALRDCLQGQAAVCSREEPCTPCDDPVDHLPFDNLLWPAECRACTASDPGKCVGEQWCRRDADGGVEPCNRCCVDLGTANGTRIDALEMLHEDNCARVYDNLDWMHHGLLECADADFPVPTRYGCCPADASRDKKDAAPLLLGDGTERPACAQQWAGGWAACRASNSVALVNGTKRILVPDGCPLHSNGRPTGRLRCRPPTLKAGLVV